MQMEVTLQVKNVTIIGSGLMGHGIALKFAQYNCNVIVVRSIHYTLSIGSGSMDCEWIAKKLDSSSLWIA